jgi:hypothetical protein
MSGVAERKPVFQGLWKSLFVIDPHPKKPASQIPECAV